jgi:4-oxalocrotonate tautomerase
VVGVRGDDRHEVPTEHDPESLNISLSFLGVERSADALLIQITLNEGRMVAQKQAVRAGLVAALKPRLGPDPTDVTINLLEVAPENWSFDRGTAQCVEGH